MLSVYVVFQPMRLAIVSVAKSTSWALTPRFHPYSRGESLSPLAVCFLWRSL